MKLNMAVTHPSPGMRSHWPDIPAMRLLCTIMTPLGRPVEPLVYMTTARSDGWGFTISLCTVGDKNHYSNLLYLQILLSWLWNSTVVKQRITYYSQVAGQDLAHPACCGLTVLLGSLLCSLSSGPHRSHASILESVTAHSEQRPTNKHTITTQISRWLVEDHIQSWGLGPLVFTTGALHDIYCFIIYVAAHKMHMYSALSCLEKMVGSHTVLNSPYSVNKYSYFAVFLSQFYILT